MSAATLARIADRLGVPVEAFTRPSAAPTLEAIAQLAADPDGVRLAAAFVTLTPSMRAALANGAESLAATAASATPIPEASAR